MQTGTAIPNLDPVLAGILRFGHTTSPQTSAFVTGTNAYVNKQNVMNYQYQQGFLSGTNVTFGYSDVRQESNSVRADFNPGPHRKLLAERHPEVAAGLRTGGE